MQSPRLLRQGCKVLRRSFPVMLCAILALAFGAAPAAAVTFTQSGDTVQIDTINDGASWTISAHTSETTESPIPLNTSNFLNDWTVPAGQTSYSIVLSPDHRRYRFDVTSIKPSQQATDTMAMPSWGYHNGSMPLNEPRVLELVRSGSVVESATITSGVPVIPAAGWACQSGDVLRLRAGVNVFAASAISITRAGVLKRGTLWLNEVNQGDEYSDDYWYSWSGAPIVVYGAAAVDDSGTGTFENPNWTGFSTTSTPNPTATVDPSGTVVASGTVNVGGIGGLDGHGIDALLGMIGLTCGCLVGKAVGLC